MSTAPDGRSVFRLPGGSLLVPVDEEQPAGACATGMREVEPGSAEYDRWAELIADAPALHDGATATGY